jgi:hypothetical protein
VEIENEPRFREALRGSVNLFLGAGFSVLAKGKGGLLPVGSDLATELRAKFHVDPDERLTLGQLSTVLARKNSDELDEFLRWRYGVEAFDERYSVLPRMRIAAIFTTNIDNLVGHLYAGSTRYYLNDLFKNGAALSSREAIELVQLHGCVDDHSRPLTFSTLDIAHARTSDPDQWNLFRQRLEARPTLFWGYGMADSGTLEAVRSSDAGAPTKGDAWIQVRPGAGAASDAAYYQALGFQVVVADTEDLLDYLAEAIAEDSSEERGGRDAGAGADYSLENVPGPGEVALRPIEEYFLGYPAAWSDIYSKSLPATSYFRAIQNMIAARQNTILAGIPGCGKTTLLMQLAAFSNFSGPKIIYDGLAEARAELLARKIGTGSALVILDNVVSDFRSFEILDSLPNAVVIGADRDYNLGSVSSRLRATDAAVMAVSDLTEYDLQDLWAAIPSRIRARQRTNPRVEGDRTPSAFEFLLANVVGTPLGQRLIESIHTMHDEGDLDGDVLLAAAYMHYARTALSIDVLVAYLRGLITDVREIYQIIDRLGDLLSEREFDNGDLFAPRSMLVAEYVLERVRPSILRSFLNRFHREVSPLRIASYNAARRRAYRWRIFSRAYPSAPEGIEVYDTIISRDNSPEVLQQKALYLADKKLYPEAFTELDLARSSNSSRFSWSVENSYYNVLFNSNFELAQTGDSESLRQCRNALDGLEKCFSKDQRKGIHSMVYADCALRLVTLLEDPDEARSTLQTAKDMLQTVVNAESWLYRPPILLKTVNRALRGFPLVTPDPTWDFLD